MLRCLPSSLRGLHTSSQQQGDPVLSRALQSSLSLSVFRCDRMAISVYRADLLVSKSWVKQRAVNGSIDKIHITFISEILSGIISTFITAVCLKIAKTEWIQWDFS